MFFWNNITFNEAGELPLRDLKPLYRCYSINSPCVWNLAPEAQCIMQNQSTLCIEKRLCFTVSLALKFKMLADLPSGRVSYIHTLDVKNHRRHHVSVLLGERGEKGQGEWSLEHVGKKAPQILYWIQDKTVETI